MLDLKFKQQVIQLLERLINMADKNAQAVADLTAEVTALTTSTSSALSAIATALANTDPDDSAAIETQVAAIKTVQGQLDSLTASLTPPATS